MMEEAAAAQKRLVEGEDGVDEQEEEAAEEDGMELEREQHQQQGEQEQQEESRRPPGLDLRAYVSQLECKVETLKAEVAARGEQVGRVLGLARQLWAYGGWTVES